ncbi:hypothetical protein B0H21DRAFT_134560 [Amylocystis lapponica]|nr:hypothetical protein B0H21DRAFT_134560 [Amylocystis lapponica]
MQDPGQLPTAAAHGSGMHREAHASDVVRTVIVVPAAYPIASALYKSATHLTLRLWRSLSSLRVFDAAEETALIPLGPGPLHLQNAECFEAACGGNRRRVDLDLDQLRPRAPRLSSAQRPRRPIPCKLQRIRRIPAILIPPADTSIPTVFTVAPPTPRTRSHRFRLVHPAICEFRWILHRDVSDKPSRQPV